MRLQIVSFAFVAITGFYTLGVCQASMQVAGAGATPSGMVWERHGEWHLNGSPADLRLGEAIPTGGLLTAGAQSGPHSITILLPDGQRLLCECYERQTCSQGFRVPAITPLPSAAIWDMFQQVRNVLLLRPASDATAFPIPVGRAEMAGNVEIVAPLNPAGEVSIAPALRVLPSGQYTLSVAYDGSKTRSLTRPARQPLNWNEKQKSGLVSVGDQGLYRISVLDQTNVPRMQIEVLSVFANSSAGEAARLKAASETIRKWNQTHGGWSLHDFLRAYLQAREAAILAAAP